MAVEREQNIKIGIAPSPGESPMEGKANKPAGNEIYSTELTDMALAFTLKNYIENSGDWNRQLAEELINRLPDGPLKEILSGHLESVNNGNVGRKSQK